MFYVVRTVRTFDFMLVIDVKKLTIGDQRRKGHVAIQTLVFGRTYVSSYSRRECGGQLYSLE